MTWGSTVTITALLDPSSAVDTGDHGILLERIRKLVGLSGTGLQCFESHLQTWRLLLHQTWISVRFPAGFHPSSSSFHLYLCFPFAESWALFVSLTQRNSCVAILCLCVFQTKPRLLIQTKLCGSTAHFRHAVCLQSQQLALVTRWKSPLCIEGIFRFSKEWSSLSTDLRLAPTLLETSLKTFLWSWAHLICMSVWMGACLYLCECMHGCFCLSALFCCFIEPFKKKKHFELLYKWNFNWKSDKNVTVHSRCQR